MLSKELAPVVLFVYNRPQQTKKVLEALCRNYLASDSILYVYMDGPRPGATSKELTLIYETREIVSKAKCFKELRTICKDVNEGLSASIIVGVTEVLAKHGKVIVVEDDIFTSPYFLYFMNSQLEIYADDKQVYQIGGCNFYNIRSSTNSFFLQVPDTWGWATWKDRWDEFEPSAEELKRKLDSDPKAKHVFSCYGSYDYWQMLNDQIDGRVNSWGIRWQATVALKKGLVLYPSPSLTNHLPSEAEQSTHHNFEVAPELMSFRPAAVRISLNVKQSSKKRVIKTLKLNKRSSFQNSAKTIKAKVSAFWWRAAQFVKNAY